jgi:hypothetical protein
MAARIGAAFGTDPVLIMRGSQFEFEVRMAAFMVWQDDERRRNQVKS